MKKYPITRFWTLALLFVLFGLLPNRALAQMDSSALLPVLAELEGVEKFAVKNDVPVLRALLEYKNDVKLQYVERFWNQYMEDPSRYQINALDTENGYISYGVIQGSDPFNTYTKSTWNLPDGSILIATETLSQGDFGEESFLSFEKYNNEIYTPLDRDAIAPTKRELAKIMEPENTDPLDFRFVLPSAGDDILFCFSERCLRLKWNDGIFKTDGDEEFRPADPPIPMNLQVTKRVELEHLLTLEFNGPIMHDERQKTINEWEKGIVLSGDERALLYGHFHQNKINAWYNLGRDAGDIEILDNLGISEETRVIIFRFVNESEDFNGDRIVIRVKKYGYWDREVSYLRGALGQGSEITTTHMVDEQSIRIYPKLQSVALPFYYIPELEQPQIDLPIQVVRITSSDCWYEFSNNTFTFECDPNEEKRNFPLSEEAMIRVRADQSAQYYIDEVNKLTTTSHEIKKELIEYLRSVEDTINGVSPEEDSAESQEPTDTPEEAEFDWGFIPFLVLGLVFVFGTFYFFIRKMFQFGKKFVESKADVSEYAPQGLSGELNQHIRSILSELEPQREVLYTKAKRVFPRAFRKTAMWIFGIGLTIWAIASIVGGGEVAYEPLIFISIVSVMLGAMLAGFYTLLRRGRIWLEFAEQFKNEILPPVLKLVNPNLTFNVKGLDETLFDHSKIFFKSSYYTASDLVEDTKTGLKVSEVMYERKDRHREAGSNDRKIIFYGLFAVSDLKSGIGDNIIQIVPTLGYNVNFDKATRIGLGLLSLWPQRSLNYDMKKLDKVEKMDFGKESFYLLASDPSMAKSLIGESTRKTIQYFVEKFGARKLLFSIVGDKLFVALDFGKNLFEPGMFLKQSLINEDIINRIGTDVTFIDQLMKEVSVLSKSLEK